MNPFDNGKVVTFPIIPRRNFDEGRIAALPDGRVGIVRQIARVIDAASGRVISEDAHVITGGVAVCIPVRRLATPAVAV